MEQIDSRDKPGRPESPSKTAPGADVSRPQTVSQNLAWAHTLLEAIPEGVLVVDDAGLIHYANRQVELLFGWDRNELVGQVVDVLLPSSFRQVHPGHREKYMREPVQKPMGTGRELRGRRKDGTDFHVEVSLSPFSTDAGTQVMCLVTDISDKITTEARLRMNEKQFEILFRAFPVPTYVWQWQEGDFVLIDYNDADQTSTNDAVRRFLNRGLRVMYPEGGQVVADIERCYREKSRFTREMPGYRLPSTGEVKDLVVTYVWIDPDLVLTIIDDVTEERGALSELNKLSSAVEQTADAVFITDRSGIIEYVNPGFELITGFTRDEALGKTPRILKSGEMPPEFYQRLWETVLSGEAFQAQTVNCRRDGTRFVAEQTIAPMKDHEGQISHFVSVLKDMTERIRLQEQETEYRLAGMVQKRLFPVQPPQIAGYDIAGAVFPAAATSGDYFDYVSMPDNDIGIVVADVCGHGMGPALIMAEARAYLRSITRYESDPRTVLSELNLQIQPDLADSSFITMILARLDPERHLLECANAGHWPAYILDRQGRVLHERQNDGFPIGLFTNFVLRQTEPIPLAPGSVAVFLTDGIPEACDVASHEFGVRRMLTVIRRHRTAPAREIVERVRDAVQRFSGPAEHADDQTIVICKRVG